MKLITLLITSVLTISCAPVTRTYYLPLDEAARVEGTHCGYVPHGGYFSKPVPPLGLAINADPSGLDLELFFQFILEEGHTLMVPLRSLSVANGDRVAEASLEVIVDQMKIAPEETLIGNPPKLILARSKVRNFDADEVSVQIPPFQVDSKKVELQPIRFTKVTKKGLMTCVQ